MTSGRGLAILPLGMVSSAAWATTSVVPPSPGFSALLQALLGLVVVLVMLYGFFWILRRFGPGQTGPQGVVKVVGGVMLGPRERLVVVEVRDTWLLVGVGAGHVSTLHTLPRPADAEATPQAPAERSFAVKLADLLKRPRG